MNLLEQILRKIFCLHEWEEPPRVADKIFNNWTVARVYKHHNRADLLLVKDEEEDGVFVWVIRCKRCGQSKK